MQYVEIPAFGDVDQLKLREGPDPEPGPGEVLIEVTSIGLNHAELMARRGEYKAASGEPPFIPGIECGGVITSVGDSVSPDRVGERVAVSPAAPRNEATGGGTYRSHYVCPADHALAVPDAVPDDQLGALWLAYLTAWGALVVKHGIGPGDIVGLPAASSSVALAAAQIARDRGAVPIGLTRYEDKAEQIQDLPTAAYEHVIATHDRDDGSLTRFDRKLKELTDGQGVDLFFDPVAAGAYLQQEIRSLASGGSVCIYGLLGKPDQLDVQPLIIRGGSITSFVLYQLLDGDPPPWRHACGEILKRFADGRFVQHLDATWPLAEVQTAHAEMEKSEHAGKLALVP